MPLAPSDTGAALGAGRRRSVATSSAANRPPSSTFRTGFLTILIVTVGVRAWTLSSWSWLQDDLLFTSEAPRTGLWDFAFQPIAGHWAPAMLGLIWSVTTIDPLNYALANASICVLAAAVVIGWGLALREIFGERLHVLAALAVLALSPAMLIDSLFWSRALGTYSIQAAMGFCLWFLARMLVRGASTRDLVGLTISYGVGLLFWEKALLITIPLLFLCLLLGPADLPGAVRNAVRHLWTVAVLTVIYIPLFLWVTRDNPPLNPDDPYARSVGSAMSFVVHGALDIALPALVGGPFTRPSSVIGFFHRSPGPVSLALFAATVILLIVGVRYRRRGWVAVGMVVAYALPAWGLVYGSSRYEVVGTVAIQSPHYSTDLLPVLLLACMFLVTRTVLDTAPPLRREVPPDALPWIRRGRLGYLAFVCVALTVTAGRTWDYVEPSSSKPWVDNLVSDARQLGKADVYDTRPPTEIVNAVLFPTAGHVSDVLGPLDLPLVYNQPTERFVMAGPDGHFREATVSGGVENVMPGPDGDCSYAVDPGDSKQIPLDGDLFEYPWAADITYFTNETAQVVVETDDDSVELELPRNEPGGLGRRQLLINGAITSFSIRSVSGGSTVCITHVQVGSLEASDEVPAKLTKD